MSWFSVNPREAICFVLFWGFVFFFWWNVLQTGGIWHDSSALNRLAEKKIPLNCGITVAQGLTTSICQLLCRSQELWEPSSEERTSEAVEPGRLSETSVAKLRRLKFCNTEELGLRQMRTLLRLYSMAGVLIGFTTSGNKTLHFHTMAKTARP